MQAVFRFPWSSDCSADRRAEKASLQNSCQLPMVDIPLLNRLKRKRTDSVDSTLSPGRPLPKRVGEYVASPTHANSALPGLLPPAGVSAGLSTPRKPEKLKLETATPSCSLAEKNPLLRQQKTPCIAPDNVTQRPPAYLPPQKPTMDSTGLTPLQQIIESQINLEILLKHDELRLIDQEIAKCQVALEQVRRCQLIPYPGQDPTTGEAVDVSTGTGPAARPIAGNPLPSQPAPWGVTDGPYTRHYARWLISDPMFDSAPLAGMLPPSLPSGRSTRGSVPTDGLPQAKSRLSRGSIATRPSNSGTDMAATNKHGPVIVKRASDGQYVKLVCMDCKEPNQKFANTQGFLNHCRISHGRNFKSHDDAAMAHGQPLAEDEMGLIANAADLSAIGNHSRRNTLTSQTMAPPETPSSNLVHPHITGTHAKPTLKLRLNGPSVVKSNANPSVQTDPPIPSSTTTKLHASLLESPLKPSTQAPHLSGLLQKKGLGGDLDRMVGEARTKSDLSVMDDPSDAECETDDMPPRKKRKRTTSATTNPKVARLPARTGICLAPPEKPTLHKGFRSVSQVGRKPETLRKANPSITTSAGHPTEVQQTPPTATAFSPESSPHTVAESNPGLVSDCDDDPEEDHSVVSEHYRPQEHAHIEEYSMMNVDDDQGEADQRLQHRDFAHGPEPTPKSNASQAQSATEPEMDDGDELAGDLTSPQPPRSKGG